MDNVIGLLSNARSLNWTEFIDFLKAYVDHVLFPLGIITCLLGLVLLFVMFFWRGRTIQDNTVPLLEDRPVVGTLSNIRTFFTNLETLWSIVLTVEVYLLSILYMTIGCDFGLIHSMISGVSIGVATLILGRLSFFCLNKKLTMSDRSIDQGSMNSLIDGFSNLAIGCYGIHSENSILVRCIQLFMRMAMNANYRRHLTEIYGTFPAFGAAVFHIFMSSKISNWFYFTLPFVYAMLWVLPQFLIFLGTTRLYTFLMGPVIGVITWIHAFFRGPTLVQDPSSESEQTSSQMLELEKQEPEQESELEESMEVRYE